LAVAEVGAADTPRPIVVKVGGSLMQAARLRDCLALIAKAERPVIIVPGGGPFADAVRDLQQKLGFDDAVAHRLAMLGMHQMAEVMCSMESRLTTAERPEDFARSIADGKVPVWLPLTMCRDDRGIPADWTITSDGLAARLAERLGGLEVILLKSVAVENESTVQQLAQREIVDPAFAQIVSAAKLPWRVLGPDDDAVLARLIGAPSP